MNHPGRKPGSKVKILKKDLFTPEQLAIAFVTDPASMTFTEFLEVLKKKCHKKYRCHHWLKKPSQYEMVEKCKHCEHYY